MGDPVSYSAAFLLGLLGSAHCVGMCGGIMNALSFAISKDQRSSTKLNFILLSYNTGRIASYTLAGILVGVLGWLVQDALGPVSFVLRIIAGILLIAMGLYLSGWWMGLRKVEELGSHIWRYIEPVGKGLMPVTNYGQALLLGALWGWLPCGMVYSVLTWAAAAGDGWSAGLLMLSFGLGTLPVMFITGRFAHVVKKFLQASAIRRLAGLLIMLFGAWTIVGATHFQGKHSHTSHEMGAEISMPAHSHQH